jgi:hypothetical protein
MRKIHPLAAIAILGVVAACTNLTPPDAVNPTVTGTSIRPTSGFFEWRIPKTVLDTTVTYVYKGCAPDAANPGRVELKTEVSVDIDARGIPDDDPFGDKGSPWIRVPLSDLQSFWQDRSLTVKKNADGTLASIASAPTNNVGAIVGSFLTTGAKVAAVVMGVPAAGAAAFGGSSRHQSCNAVMETNLYRAKALETQIKSGTLTQKQVSDASAQFQAVQALLTITEKKTVDPGKTAVEGGPDGASVGADGRIAVLRPEQKKLIKWVDGDPLDMVPFTVTLALDFAEASPPILQKCPQSDTCPRHLVRIDRETHFREPAYVPVRVKRGGVHAENPANRTVEDLGVKVLGDAKGGNAIAFAQFGLPRAVPIGAGLFQKFNMSVAFNEFGGLTEQTLASDAVGTRLTSFLSSGAGAANAGGDRGPQRHHPARRRDPQGAG